MSQINPCFKNSDSAGPPFQYLEDLATGYWYSESLFAALELRLFHHIENRAMDTAGLARSAGCRLSPLSRLMAALAQMELVSLSGGRWYNTPLARQYLLPDQPDYMGDFLLYRRYLQPGWNGLAEYVAGNGTRLSRLSSDDDYERRNFHYVRALDGLARLKSPEITAVLAPLDWVGPVLDVGGGGGALSRRLIQDRTAVIAVLLDLPEVLDVARRLYPQPGDWRGLLPVACDFRFDPPFGVQQKFGLVLMSNFLHTYGPEAAEKLITRAGDLLKPDGMILIHDYFPDVPSVPSPRGGLHDVNMMLNTTDGVCHKAGTVMSWLSALGLDTPHIVPLPSDSAIILAGQRVVPLSSDCRHHIAEK